MAPPAGRRLRLQRHPLRRRRHRRTRCPPRKRLPPRSADGVKMARCDEDFDDEDGRYVVIEREKEGSSVGAFLLGAAIGAGLALLFAPQSGRETRAAIKRRAKNAGDT